MSNELVQKLAIAYAQAYLVQALQKDPGKVWDDNTVRSFLKCYDYAAGQISTEYDSFDEHF